MNEAPSAPPNLHLTKTPQPKRGFKKIMVFHDNGSLFGKGIQYELPAQRILLRFPNGRDIFFTIMGQHLVYFAPVT